MYRGRFLSVIIAAGGMGTRFGADPYETVPKQFINVGGNSMIIAAAQPFLECGYADEIIFVAPVGYARHTCKLIVREMDGVWSHAKKSVQQLTVDHKGKRIEIKVVHGGDDRAASVQSGLTAIDENASAGGLVLIHDAARPYVSVDLIIRVLETAYKHGAAVPVTHVSDTVYVDGGDGFVAGIPERKRLRGVQTPQGFDLDTIRKAHGHALAEGFSPTDDGTPVFTSGGRIALVEGDTSNIKITVPEDLPDVAALWGGGVGLRIGIGFDAHRFGDGRALVLGGVHLPHEKGLIGHSDADVLTHALMDAILGAMHEGDIGKLFPDTDPVFEGVSSIELLKGVVSLMDRRGYRIENADLTLVAERPRIAPYRARIEESLAYALETNVKNVSLKATTTEKLGFTGREEGIAAEAVVLIKNKNVPKGGSEE